MIFAKEYNLNGIVRYLMEIKIANDIKLNIQELQGNNLLQVILSDLTIENPAYIKAVRMDLRSKYNIPETIKLFQFDNNILILPRGYGRKLLQRFKETSTVYQAEDNRLTLPPVQFNSSIRLRDYQTPAVDALVKNRQGGVVAGCGAGKTQIVLEAIARIRQPALWICHTYELLQQTLERACSVLNMVHDEIGVIANGKVKVGERLTLALIQTLNKADLSQLINKFGLIVIDEAHHLAAKSFFDTIGKFPALYRIWASATPERSDGLSEMVYVCGGPILYTINSQELPTVTPMLKVVETNFTSCYSADEYTKLISNLINNNARNELIVKTIATEVQGNYSLVLSDRVEHLEILQEMLRKALPGLVIEVLTGSLNKKTRREMMDRVNNRQIDVLLATQLAREGLDIIHLNRLFLTTPKRAGGAVQQECGRIMRPCPGKSDAIVYDFWDSKSPILKSQFWARREVYRKLGMQQKSGSVRRYANA